MFSAVRPMPVLGLTLGLGLLSLASAPLASAQVVAAGGKNTQAVATCLPFDDVTDDAVITVNVPYGRKNRMLLINAHTRGMGGQQCRMSLVMTVGPAAEESFGGSVGGVQGGTDTSFGHWWADLDANEASVPGAYIGVPVPVELRVAKNPNDLCHITCVTLDVQMVKK